MASYINHSCISTARRAFIGDMMIARATQDLAPDTEITWWYYIPKSSGKLGERQKELNHWGFSCSCALCEDEANTNAAVLAKRKKLLQQYARSRLSDLKTVLTTAEEFINAMDATYARPASEVPRLAVWESMHRPIKWVLDNPKARVNTSAIKLILLALKSLGYVIDGGIPMDSTVGKSSGNVVLVVRHWGLLLDGVPALWKYLGDLYRILAPELVGPAEEYARATYRMVNGEDETFESYGD